MGKKKQKKQGFEERERKELGFRAQCRDKRIRVWSSTQRKRELGFGDVLLLLLGVPAWC
jgi:hypothetical protein